MRVVRFFKELMAKVDLICALVHGLKARLEDSEKLRKIESVLEQDNLGYKKQHEKIREILSV